MATAIITGASQGIGACIAKRLAQDGFDVVINHYPSDGDKEKALAVAEECRAFGVKAECYAADVSKYDQCEAMVKQIKADFGNIDALVNNAGITKDKLLARMSEEDYDAVIAVNQKSVYNMTKHVTAVMMKQRSGRIVNVASVAGLYGNPGQMNYSASKAAIIGMTKTTAKEFGSRNITCNAVAPGLIRTPMTDVLSDELKEKMISAVALRRYGEPEEIASVVSFLVSDNASYVTGQVIEISGGLSM
ncbi:MAG: 3-oxoacyl-[Ruminococcus sp.]|uniref:3-oxoacyl-[acyl-carrier-protein] reductase n=1 Tax=Ruminococcus sp. TaxID=41978 RepID=UPI0025DCE57B|nr:3-oxoacyl-[acyl-carrier-protein] reductase [Ruminococcus sp.]MBR5683934.1 3-oxoacyl-[acyl-carrier-protein] reductase [Ruminococcus sp.]